MSSHQETPPSPAQAHPQQSDNEQDDVSSHYSQEIIDSQPTSPSHSTIGEDNLDKLHITVQDPSSPSDQGEPETDPELFKDPEPAKADSAEIQEFSHLAEELSLFASCIVAPPPPPPPASPDSPTSPSSPSFPTSNTYPYTDADKTPTQASSSTSASQAEADAAALQASHAQALISQRKAELQADLMELIQDEADGRNRELILGIERLMRDWKGLYEGLERWRGEKKGERVREMYKREMEE
ncbi:hypothetical protein DL98DRAFT_524853 [Cadophora sp. DSE1049]|nr:hypothetical protein DL98DRAFT_524853 [Cadophora sp. DSE1049]